MALEIKSNRLQHYYVALYNQIFHPELNIISDAIIKTINNENIKNSFWSNVQDFIHGVFEIGAGSNCYESGKLSIYKVKSEKESSYQIIKTYNNTMMVSKKKWNMSLLAFEESYEFQDVNVAKKKLIDAIKKDILLFKQKEKIIEKLKLFKKEEDEYFENKDSMGKIKNEKIKKRIKKYINYRQKIFKEKNEKKFITFYNLIIKFLNHHYTKNNNFGYNEREMKMVFAKEYMPLDIFFKTKKIFEQNQQEMEKKNMRIKKIFKNIDKFYEMYLSLLVLSEPKKSQKLLENLQPNLRAKVKEILTIYFDVKKLMKIDYITQEILDEWPEELQQYLENKMTDNDILLKKNHENKLSNLLFNLVSYFNKNLFEMKKLIGKNGETLFRIELKTPQMLRIAEFDKRIEIILEKC